MTAKYPELVEGYAHLIKMGELYAIDLTDANEKEKHGNAYGAQPNDINLDMCASIHDYNHELPPQNIINFVIDNLTDWGYDFDEIAQAIANTRLEVEAQ